MRKKSFFIIILFDDLYILALKFLKGPENEYLVSHNIHVCSLAF